MQRAARGAPGLVFYLWKTAVPVGLSPLCLLEATLDPWTLRYVVFRSSYTAAAHVDPELVRDRGEPALQRPEHGRRDARGVPVHPHHRPE